MKRAKQHPWQLNLQTMATAALCICVGLGLVHLVLSGALRNRFGMLFGAGLLICLSFGFAAGLIAHRIWVGALLSIVLAIGVVVLFAYCIRPWM